MRCKDDREGEISLIEIVFLAILALIVPLAIVPPSNLCPRHLFDQGAIP